MEARSLGDVMSAKPFENSINRLRKQCQRHFPRFTRTLAVLLLGFLFALPAYGLQIGAGLDHGFFIRDDGTLWTWGGNASGTLGDGGLVSRAMPMRVFDRVASAAGGGYHTAAIRTDGTLWVWGFNDDGQLGTGGTESHTAPVQIMSNVRAVAAGLAHTLALKTDGTLWACGRNSSGQLGDGSTTARNSPVLIMSGVRDIGAGDFHSLAIKTDGTLWAWGGNSGGQVGNNSTTDRNTPVQVATAVFQVAGGKYHSMAVRTDNSVWVWGYNGNGQLGNGTTTALPIPTQIMTGAVEVRAGGYHSMVRKADGTVWAFGYNGYGELGDGSYTGRLAPVQVNSGAVGLATGTYFSLVLKNDASIWSTGTNELGQLGDGGIINRGAPTYPLASVQQAATGGFHSLAVKSDGTLWAWGANGWGQIGKGTSAGIQNTPVQVLTSMRSAAAGQLHSLAVRTDGALFAWGSNDYGQLGDGSTTARSAPGQVLSSVREAAAGEFHTLAIKTDGSLWGWGRNYNAQLGLGNTADQSAPVQIMNSVQAVAAGYWHTLALKSDGTVWAWGYNGTGQIGDGSTNTRSSPVQILSGVRAIAAGNKHSLAIKNDGTLWAWGGNSDGQLGDGTTTDRSAPVQVASSIQSVSAGSVATMAVKTDGTVWTWGSNISQLTGPGAATTETKPRLNPFLSGATAVSSKRVHGVALMSDGRLANWGNNAQGQLAVTRAMSAASYARVIDSMGIFGNTALVTEHYNPSIRHGAGTLGIGHYFVTAGNDERSAIEGGSAGPGWSQTGRFFRAYYSATGAPSGAVGVCRFYAAEPNSHFYTASAGECQNLRNMNPTNNPALGWAYEGIAFYTLLPSASGCGTDFYPVYRSYNNRFGPPATNDGNHRLTPSYNDHYRVTKFFGYADEGVAFCSPVKPIAGGDLHASYAYPGASVQSGAAITAEFVFSNNGPGKGDGGSFYAVLPGEVANWSVTCSSRYGATCPSASSLSASALRNGVALSSWPAGAGVTLTARGNAPQVGSGGDLTLTFAATVSPGTGLPDPNTANNTVSTAQTVVRAASACNYVITPPGLSFGAAAQTGGLSISVAAGCAWSAQSNAPWLGLSTGGAPAAVAGGNGPGILTVSVIGNAGAAERTGTVTIQGQQLLVSQAGAPPAPAAACNNLKLQRTGDQVSAEFMSGAISFEVMVDASCQWQAASQASWVTTTGGASGKGNGTVSYRTDPNPLPTPRTGTILVGNQTFTVTQFGAFDGPGGDGGGDGGGE